MNPCCVGEYFDFFFLPICAIADFVLDKVVFSEGRQRVCVCVCVRKCVRVCVSVCLCVYVISTYTVDS